MTTSADFRVLPFSVYISEYKTAGCSGPDHPMWLGWPWVIFYRGEIVACATSYEGIRAAWRLLENGAHEEDDEDESEQERG